jgi:hypothetical protein
MVGFMGQGLRGKRGAAKVAPRCLAEAWESKEDLFIVRVVLVVM